MGSSHPYCWNRSSGQEDKAHFQPCIFVVGNTFMSGYLAHWRYCVLLYSNCSYKKGKYEEKVENRFSVRSLDYVKYHSEECNCLGWLGTPLPKKQQWWARFPLRSSPPTVWSRGLQEREPQHTLTIRRWWLLLACSKRSSHCTWLELLILN